MSKKIKFGIIFLSILVWCACPVFVMAGVPAVSNLFITDVTPKSFSVIWAANEACTADIEVYEDASGTTIVPGIVIEPHPVESGDVAIKEAAENNGVMKVRVTGLAFDTTYYFQTITTSKSTSDITLYPGTAPFMAVTTEVQTVRTYTSGSDVLPFSNDIIIEECYLEAGVTPAEGTLLMATVTGGNYPLTAFIGDGVDLPYALIDLNNMYSRETFETLDLMQGENLTLLNFRGITGNSIVTNDVPLDEDMSEVKFGEFALKVGWNMVSVQLEPNNTDISTVLDPIFDYIDAVWAYDAFNEKWYSIDKSVPEFLWDLTDIHSFEGLWFVMNSEASLKVNGGFNQNSIQLYEGWNLVGSKSIETVTFSQAISAIYDKVDAIWHYDTADEKWYSIDKSVPEFLWDLDTIEPGKSYWFVMNEDTQW